MPRCAHLRWYVARRRLTWIVMLAWVIGVELGPDLHVALHAHLAAHHHAGAAVVADPAVHVHTTTSHRHGPDGEDVWDDESSTEDTEGSPDHPGPTDAPAGPPHGAGSLAHHAAALPPAPPPITAPIIIWTIRVALLAAPSEAVALAPVPEAGARAPPG